MADINFEDLGKTITNAAEAVGKRTEIFIGIQKLRGQINAAERSIDKNYKDLGEIIFRRYATGESVDEEVAIICEEISQVQVNITEFKEELAKKKGCCMCPVCEAEVPSEALFCMRCGAQMPEKQAEATDPEEGLYETEETVEVVQEEPEVSVETIFEEEAEVENGD